MGSPRHATPQNTDNHSPSCSQGPQSKGYFAHTLSASVLQHASGQAHSVAGTFGPEAKVPEDPASPSSSLVLAAREGSFPIVFSSPQTRALWGGGGGGGEERREERNSSANLPSTQVRLKFLPGPLSPEDAYSRTIWPAARLMKIKTAVTSSETVLTIILAGLRDPERRPRGGREATQGCTRVN